MLRILLTLLLFLALLTGCSDSERDRAATQALTEAQAQEQLVPAAQGIARYQQLIDRYPKTAQAQKAQAAIVQLQRHQQEILFQRSAAQLLERVSMVLNGYQSFSGKLPRSLDDLNSGGYMFDSEYLATMLPEGAALYLLLAGENQGPRMWLQQAGHDKVLSRGLNDARLTNVTMAELLSLKSRWHEAAKVGRLIQVDL